MTKYNHIWKSADAGQQIFQRKATCGEKKKKINKKTTLVWKPIIQQVWKLTEHLSGIFASPSGAQRAGHRGGTSPAGRTHHAGCAPDVSRGVVPWPYQHLQGPVLPGLDILSEVLVLKGRNVLLNSSRLLRTGESTTRIDQSSLPVHFSCILHPH